MEKEIEVRVYEENHSIQEFINLMYEILHKKATQEVRKGFDNYILQETRDAAARYARIRMFPDTFFKGEKD